MMMIENNLFIRFVGLKTEENMPSCVLSNFVLQYRVRDCIA